MEKRLTPIEKKAGTIIDFLEDKKVEFAKALPRVAGLSTENFFRVAMTTIRKNPKLISCTVESLTTSLLQAAQLGLPVDPLIGQAYLVPFGSECTLIIGYRGLTSIVARYGKIRNIYARVVRERDIFRLVYGLEEKLEHEPCRDGEPGELVAAYAIAAFNDGAKHFTVMFKPAIEKRRAVAKTKMVWDAWAEEMWKKTVIRQICKDIPLSLELSQDLATVDENEFSGNAIDVQAVAEEPQLANVTDMFHKAKEQTEEKPVPPPTHKPRQKKAAKQEPPTTGEPEVESLTGGDDDSFSVEQSQARVELAEAISKTFQKNGKLAHMFLRDYNENAAIGDMNLDTVTAALEKLAEMNKKKTERVAHNQG